MSNDLPVRPSGEPGGYQSFEKRMGEMTTNRRLLLAGTIAAVALLVVPAMAMSAVWKHQGENLNKFVEIGLSGAEVFETTEDDGMNCGIHATLTTEGESTAKITAFEIEECPFGFGSFAKCEVVTAQAKGLPWTVHVNASDLTITKMRIKRTFNAGCETTEVDKTIESTTVTLTSASAITAMEFSGSTSGYSTIGSFTVDSPNSGTYGIG